LIDPTSQGSPAGLPPGPSSSSGPVLIGSGAGGSGGSGSGATGSGARGSGDSSGGPAGGPGLTVATGDLAPFGFINLGVGTFDGLDWAVPALAMTVPGLLLILAVLAQLSASVVWLPIVRRRLGGFGVGRRRRGGGAATPANP
jgi:hypothetical protein